MLQQCGKTPHHVPLAVCRESNVALTGLGESVLGVLDEAGVARQLVVTRRLGLLHSLPRPAHLHRNILLRNTFRLAGVPLVLLRFVVERIGGGDAEPLADGLASGRAAVRSNGRPLESATAAAQAVAALTGPRSREGGSLCSDPSPRHAGTNTAAARSERGRESAGQGRAAVGRTVEPVLVRFSALEGRLSL